MRRIGVLFVLDESNPEVRTRISALQNGLQHHAWINGENVHIDYRWGAGDLQRIRAYAAELVALNPDVIIAGTTSARWQHCIAKPEPSPSCSFRWPIRSAADLFSLANPGGNLADLPEFEFGVGAKWPELLKQISPRVARMAFVHDPANPAAKNYLHAIEEAAASLGVTVSSFPVQSRDEIKARSESFARDPNGGLIVQPGPVTSANRELIIASAAQHKLPAVYVYRYFVTDGGLASYEIDNIDLHRRAASYVDRILKGAKPADLPVEQPTKFELVINLKTANARRGDRRDIPPSCRRCDRIEATRCLSLLALLGPAGACRVMSAPRGEPVVVQNSPGGLSLTHLRHRPPILP